jgi:hypothetical protein
MRMVTKLTLQYWSILALIYGGCTLLAGLVLRRIYLAVVQGEISVGRHGDKIVTVLDDPFRYWASFSIHVVVAMLFLGMIAYFAREMRHGPWRRRR